MALAQIGSIAIDTLKILQLKLPQLIPNIRCQIMPKSITIPPNAYSPARKQYHSTPILKEISTQTQLLDTDKLLGIANADLFVPELNFVFGEAECPGKVAIISLWRLRPEFYGDEPDTKLFELRILKEAVHELGHTFGLSHSKNPLCVMFFSNDIRDTDFKQTTPCSDCLRKLNTIIKST